VDTKKLDINACILGVPAKHRVKVHVIRIGILNDYSPRKIEMQKGSDGRLIVIPPRLNGLRIKQQSFRQFAEQYKWNYILDNNTEDNKDEDDGEDDEDALMLTKKTTLPAHQPRAIKSANITLLMSR